MKFLASKRFWLALALGLGLASALAFDGDPSPQCRPDGTHCVPSPTQPGN